MFLGFNCSFDTILINSGATLTWFEKFIAFFYIYILAKCSRGSAGPDDTCTLFEGYFSSVYEIPMDNPNCLEASLSFIPEKVLWDDSIQINVDYV